MRRNPVQNDAETRAVALVDEAGKVLRVAEARRWRELRKRLKLARLLSAGTHSVKLVSSQSDDSQTLRVSIKAGEETRRHVKW